MSSAAGAEGVSSGGPVRGRSGWSGECDAGRSGAACAHCADLRRLYAAGLGSVDLVDLADPVGSPAGKRSARRAEPVFASALPPITVRMFAPMCAIRAVERCP
ncbi:hypothetical protein GCM10027570_05570 [Streptomonospora sediminis]